MAERSRRHSPTSGSRRPRRAPASRRRRPGPAAGRRRATAPDRRRRSTSPTADSRPRTADPASAAAGGASPCVRACVRAKYAASQLSNKLSSRERRDDMPPPMAVRLAADLRPSADGSAVRPSLVAGGGVSGSQRAYSLGQLRPGTDRRADRGIA